MATLRQLQANRKNALRSTGPVTAAAKAAVRFNALKSGIDAASELIPGEDPAQLKALADCLIASWQPADEREQELVDQLIDDAWRLRRLRRAETQIYTASIEGRRTCRIHRPHTETGDAFGGNSEILSRLQRLVTSMKRSSHQTTVDLERLQAARRKAAAAVVDPEPQAVEALTIMHQAQTEIAEQCQSDASQVPPAPPQSTLRPAGLHHEGPSVEVQPNHESLA